jgi:hypothetical protein
VTTIGSYAFDYCYYMTNAIIGNNVARIGDGAFFYCYGLTSISIPDSVTTIGSYAFDYCYYMTSTIIGNNVARIGDGAFYDCSSLTSVHFRGDAPLAGSSLFDGASPTIYYLPGTLGWGATFATRPTALWLLPAPLILTSSPAPGVRTNQFGFTISWASNSPVVVEACTDLGAPAWTPVKTNTLVGGTAYFSDPEWSNHPSRFYRLRSP